MRPEKRFHIARREEALPHSECTIFVDGIAGDAFREGRDIELSHGLPNRTLDKYKSGSSVEFCFKFLDDESVPPYDLVVNRHLDLDGVLSVFVLSYPSEAMRYRDLLCDASKTGDFWGWSEGKALLLFQELTLLYKDLQSQSSHFQSIYEKCFERLFHILHNPAEMSEAQKILEEQQLLIETEKIQRLELAPRLVSYYVPLEISKNNTEAFLQTPQFNEPISRRLALWPQVRNRLDSEKLQLIAVETPQGIHYDLWCPGYSWADTKGLWRPRGLSLPKRVGEFQEFQWPDFSELIQKLNVLEDGVCQWRLFPGISFTPLENPREFPIVATTLPSSHNQLSHLPLNKVLQLFKGLDPSY